MDRRIGQLLKALSMCIVAGALTWLLSWLLQFVCSIIIADQVLHLISTASNRLALVTVLATVVVMVVVLLFLVLDGFAVMVAIVFFGGLAILGGLPQTVFRLFLGTTVATQPAHIIYSIVVALWGILMWYIFLLDVTDRLDGN